MFLRKNNKVKVDFIEINKESQIGTIISFDKESVVIKFDGDDFESMIPYHNISVIEAIDPKNPAQTMPVKTQQ